MTKGEAWKAHLGTNWDGSHPFSAHRRHCFEAGYEAAAEKDSRALLELLAKRYEAGASIDCLVHVCRDEKGKLNWLNLQTWKACTHEEAATLIREGI